MEDSPRAPPRADVPVVGTNLQPAEEASSPAHRNWWKEAESATEAGWLAWRVFTRRAEMFLHCLFF